MATELLSCWGVAVLLRVEVETVYQWRWRGAMPTADVDLNGHPGWRLSTIERWARKTGRME